MASVLLLKETSSPWHLQANLVCFAIGHLSRTLADRLLGSILRAIALLCVCAGIVLQFLVMLSGSSAGGPVNRVYFLQTTTDYIPTLRNPARWTFLAMCGSTNSTRSVNINCGETAAAPPFDPPMNFATSQGVPFQFLETSRFYWLSKAMFGLYLVATFFSLLSLCTGLAALFKLTGDFKSGFTAILACVFQALASGVMRYATTMCVQVLSDTVSARGLWRAVTFSFSVSRMPRLACWRSALLGEPWVAFQLRPFYTF